MEIKKINGDSINIDLHEVSNIFDLKCKLGELDNLHFYDIKILLNGIEINNNCKINNFAKDKLFYVPINSNLGFKVKHLSI